MNLRTVKRKSCLSSLIILFCALAMVGCDRGPKNQKAPAAPATSVAPVAPAAPTTSAAPVAPAAPKTAGLPRAQTAPAKAAPVPQVRIGKYLNKKYPHDFIELKGDGTFIMQEDKKSTAGAFAVAGKNITFMLKGGSGSVCTIDDRGITDSNGELWARP